MRSQRHFLQRSTMCYAFLIGQEIRVHWGEASFILRLLNTYPNSRHIGPFSLFPITGSLIGKNTTRPIFRTVAQLCLSQNLCNPLTTPDNLVYPKIHREGIYCSRLCDICTLIFFFSEFGIERCHKISGWGAPLEQMSNVEYSVYALPIDLKRCSGVQVNITCGEAPTRKIRTWTTWPDVTRRLAAKGGMPVWDAIFSTDASIHGNKFLLDCV